MFLIRINDFRNEEYKELAIRFNYNIQLAKAVLQHDVHENPNEFEEKSKPYDYLDKKNFLFKFIISLTSFRRYYDKYKHENEIQYINNNYDEAILFDIERRINI